MSERWTCTIKTNAPQALLRYMAGDPGIQNPFTEFVTGTIRKPKCPPVVAMYRGQRNKERIPAYCAEISACYIQSAGR